jgi:hypothetical protein
MASGWELSGRTIASLQRGDSLEFQCGHCGRHGRVTVTELRFRRVPYTTRIEAMIARVVCKGCGRKSAQTKVWTRSGR